MTRLADDVHHSRPRLSGNRVYPATVDGTPCYCGKRHWNQDSPSYAGPTTKAPPARLPRRGTLVRLAIDGLTTLWFVDQVDRDAGMFHVEGKGWHEAGEVIR